MTDAAKAESGSNDFLRLEKYKNMLLKAKNKF